MKIRDRQLSRVYERVRSQNAPIDDQVVLELLAAVGDRAVRAMGGVLKELRRPGLGREQQLEIAKRGMSNKEQADLAAILDANEVPIAPSARNFLEALVGRAPLDPGAPLRLMLDPSQAGGKLQGSAAPGATVEAINLSEAPLHRVHVDDTMPIATADAFGKFIGELPDVQQGDVLRVRARDAQGTPGEWVTVRADGLAAKDARNAQLAAGRIGMADRGNGKVALASLDGRPISEPGATLRFVNERTGFAKEVVLGSNGELPEGFSLDAKAGDKVRVALSDGVHNTSFSTVADTLTVPDGGSASNGAKQLDDPLPWSRHCDGSGKPTVGKTRLQGPLFGTGGPSAKQVLQGQLPNCYFASTMGSIAHHDPEALRKAIRDNGDGTYTVSFWERDDGEFGEEPPDTWHRVEIKVDADFYTRPNGNLLYASCLDGALWLPLIEKAFAQWKGSYEKIEGTSVKPIHVLQALLGRPATQFNVERMGADYAWTQIKDALAEGRPGSAGTFPTDDGRYFGSGVHDDHEYSIFGCREEGGKRFVTLRNPWAHDEPAGNGPDDGVFELPFEKFLKLFNSVALAGGKLE